MPSSAFDCCWLLNGWNCVEECSRSFRKPSLPIIERLSYSDHCVDPTAQTATTPNLNETNGLVFSCADVLLEKRAECFPVCTTWMRKKMAGLEQGGNATELTGNS